MDLLVTPHMAVYEKAAGIPPLAEDADTVQVMCRYADLMYMAALNAWELDGRGTMEDYPIKRGDFHAFMQADRKGFAAAVSFLVSALTGKTVKELEKEKPAEEPERKEGEAAEPVKKKGFFCRIMSR